MLPPPRRISWPRLAEALLLVFLAFLLRLALTPLVTGLPMSYSTFFLAITVAAWRGGLWPGLLAMATSMSVANHWFVPAKYAFANASIGTLLPHLFFILTTTSICVLSESLHRARDRAEAQAAQIQERELELAQRISEKERAEAARKHHEEALRSSEERLRNLNAELERSQESLRLTHEVAQVGTFDWNIPAKTIVWSPELEKLYGLAPGGFRGTHEHWMACLHPDDLPGAEAAIREALAGSFIDGEWRAVWPAGTVRWIAARGKVFRGPAGEPLRMLGVSIDVTERKTAENALRQADRRKDEFLAMLAHELRNPLGAVQHAIRVWEEDPEKPDSVLWVQSVIARQTGQLNRLVDDLLDVSRISQGKIRLLRERLDLAQVLDQAVEAVRPLLAERRHELTQSYPAGTLWVDGDAVRLQQIIGNLLVNAAKYSDHGGRIWLEAEGQRGQVIVRLRDTGHGIPPDRILEMFELFAQGERSLARSEGGLGLGLTIVRKLVELHGGDVTAQSDGDGHGSEFTIRLPAAFSVERPHQIPVVSPAASLVNGRNPKRVLVVDDNRDSAEGLERLLKRRGCSVAVAYDGPEALEVAAQFRPEVVLLDIGLPGMDGYDVARRLRAQPVESLPLIVAISGYGQESDRHRALEAGFDLYLTKPVDFHYLKELLKLGA